MVSTAVVVVCNRVLDVFFGRAMVVFVKVVVVFTKVLVVCTKVVVVSNGVVDAFDKAMVVSVKDVVSTMLELSFFLLKL